MTLVEIELEMHRAMKPFLNHWLRFIGRHAGGQFIIGNLQVDEEFMAHVFHPHHFTGAGAFSKRFIGDGDELRADAKEHLLVLMGLDLTLQSVV